MRIHVKKRLGDFTININITCNALGITAIYGTSGAGKTTLINMIAGLIKPDSGIISLNNTPLFDSYKNINLPPEKRHIGYVFQEGCLFPHLCVHSNLVYGMNLVPEKNKKIPFPQVISLLGIEHLLNRRPKNLSGGEKQRIALGRALLTTPALLLMDEPLASLDNERKQELLPFIVQINKEFSIPVIYVSHALEEIRTLTNTIVTISNGHVVTN